jgi:hypothetical protein
MLLASHQWWFDDFCGDDRAVDTFSGSVVNTMGGLVLLNCDGVASLASGAIYGWLLMVNGSRSFSSLIVMTIFSRSSGVICFSLPRLRLQPESCLRTRVLVRDADVDATSLSNLMASSTTRLGGEPIKRFIRGGGRSHKSHSPSHCEKTSEDTLINVWLYVDHFSPPHHFKI